MDNVNNEVLTRVWQRVHPNETTILNPSQLSDFLYCEGCLAATYLHLLRHSKGNFKQILRRLYQQKRSSISCLQGICALLDSRQPPLPQAKNHQGRAGDVLRRCYRDALQCTSLYDSHSSHPEYGYAFTQLAQQSQLHCQTLLQLLGALSSKDNYVNTTKLVYFSRKR